MAQTTLSFELIQEHVLSKIDFQPFIQALGYIGLLLLSIIMVLIAIYHILKFIKHSEKNSMISNYEKHLNSPNEWDLESDEDEYGHDSSGWQVDNQKHY